MTKSEKKQQSDRRWHALHGKERQRRWREEHPGGDKEYQRKSKYGLTKGQYDQLLQEQQGLCAICGEQAARLVIDHDHAAGNVRGLLCGLCNMLLGGARDSIVILARAINYLGAQS